MRTLRIRSHAEARELPSDNSPAHRRYEDDDGEQNSGDDGLDHADGDHDDRDEKRDADVRRNLTTIALFHKLDDLQQQPAIKEAIGENEKHAAHYRKRDGREKRSGPDQDKDGEKSACKARGSRACAVIVGGLRAAGGSGSGQAAEHGREKVSRSLV